VHVKAQLVTQTVGHEVEHETCHHHPVVVRNRRKKHVGTTVDLPAENCDLGGFSYDK
jgi:hypothetical protein